jgi:alpha-D-ribose 1-methylphosphonate 5-triphosphate synthase subunit PhnG
MSAPAAEWRAELLARADPDALISLAERCLASGPPPTVTVAPEVGTVVLEVREPVAHHRFHLAEVLACRAEVHLAGGRGWAMRLDDDREATLAAAVCDAEVDAGRPLAGDVEHLCRITEDRLRREQEQEWAELAPTEVTFEELD